MLYLIFLLPFTAFAKDIVSINAKKNTQMPVGIINSHSPDSISYNKTFIESLPQAQNIFATLNGNHSVEYQQNIQDMGGHTGVSINQLPFYYTSTFIDGIYIPDNTLDASQLFSADSSQSVKVNRGSSSTGYAPSSLAGSVNIETIDVDQNESSVKTLFGNYGNVNSSFLLKHKVNESSGIFGSFSANRQSVIDKNKDNIAESPQLKNFQATVGHQFNNKDLKIKTRFDFSENTRNGGSVIKNRNNTEGNPFNFQNGGSSINNGWIDEEGHDVIYDKGTAGMMENINIKRTSVLSSVESQNYISGGVVSVLNRNNFYMGNKYNSDETNVFVTSARKFEKLNGKFKLGGDFNHQKLKSSLNYDSNSNPDGYTYNTTSIFANANHSFNKLDTDLSIRIVNNNQFNNINIVRGKVNYHHNDNIISTLSAGNGYFIPSSSFEQNHSMLEEKIEKLERKINKATESFNASYNTTFSFDKLQLNLNYNYNEIKNIATLDIEDENAIFRNLNGKYKVQGLGFDGSYFISQTLLFGLSAERYWHDLSKLEDGFVILSRPEYKISANITKKIEKHTVKISSSYIGRQDLEKFYGEVYNLSGNKNGKYSKEYLLLDVDYSYNINKKYKFFAGINNILNFVQIDQSNQLATRVSKHEEHHGHGAEHSHIDNINSWGPVRGRFIYTGIKLSL